MSLLALYLFFHDFRSFFLVILRCSSKSGIFNKDTPHYPATELLLTFLFEVYPLQVLHPHTEAEFLIWATAKSFLKHSLKTFQITEADSAFCLI